MITIESAKKIYGLVGEGLVGGMGSPEPGQMCIEAAICIALGEPFGDRPSCVGQVDRRFSIALNDKSWSSPAARAAGMRSLSIAQLGSVDRASERTDQWVQIISEQTIRQLLPVALRAAARLNPESAEALESAARRCEIEGTRDSSLAARDVARAAHANAYAYAYTANAAAAAAHAAAAAAAYNAAYDASDAYTNAAAHAAAAYAYAYAYAAHANAYAYAYDAANAYAARAISRDEVLSLAAKIAVDAYREIGAPGIEFLDQIEGV